MKETTKNNTTPKTEEIIGVKFVYGLKVYDFLAGKHKVQLRDQVVVDTSQGVEIGQVVYVGRTKSQSEEPIKEIERLATKEDIEKFDELQERAKEYFPIFSDKIGKYNLPMSPVGVNLSLDGSKLICYFTADGRVDFRELSKDLSRAVKKQAVMRQIGPRDEARLIGGYGRCGRPVCCATFLTGTEGVTMETVESQYGMPKSASKVSGICGRLMCCLNYEIVGKNSIKKSKIKKES